MIASAHCEIESCGDERREKKKKKITTGIHDSITVVSEMSRACDRLKVVVCFSLFDRPQQNYASAFGGLV